MSYLVIAACPNHVEPLRAALRTMARGTAAEHAQIPTRYQDLFKKLETVNARFEANNHPDGATNASRFLIYLQDKHQFDQAVQILDSSGVFPCGLRDGPAQNLFENPAPGRPLPCGFTAFPPEPPAPKTSLFQQAAATALGFAAALRPGSRRKPTPNPAPARS
jgi:hypothetical protein